MTVIVKIVVQTVETPALVISVGYGRFKLRPEFDTQRKIADYFAGEEKCDKNDRLCKALMGLVDETVETPALVVSQRTVYVSELSRDTRMIFTLFIRVLDKEHLINEPHKRFTEPVIFITLLLTLIDSTTMLTCAEDLGMIPDCVPAVMSELQMLSLEIQRMPKDPTDR